MRDLSVHSVSDVINRPTSSMNPLYSASKGESSNSSSSSASKNDDQHGVAFSPLPLHDIGNSGIYGDDCNDDDLSIIVLWLSMISFSPLPHYKSDINHGDKV